LKLRQISTASPNRHFDVVNALIEARADLNMVVSDQTALHWACRHPNGTPIVATLLAAGALIDVPGAESPISNIIMCGSIETLKLLIAAGADVNRSIDHIPPLSCSVSFSDIAAAKLLLDAKADVNHPRSDVSASALHTAIHIGHLEMVKLFVASDGDMTTRNPENKTWLHMIVSCGPQWKLKPIIGDIVSEGNPHLGAKILKHPPDFPGVFKALVDAKADISARASRGATPLIAATAAMNIEAVKAMLEAGANPDDITDNGITALLLATQIGRLDIVSALIAAGADVNFTSPNPSHLSHIQTPVDMALDGGQDEIAAILKDAGALTWHWYAALSNPLFTVCRSDTNKGTGTGSGTGADNSPDPQTAQFNGTLISSVSSTHRENALRIGVRLHKLSIVKDLLAAGVNPSLLLSSMSVLSYASRMGDTDIVRELIAAGADITAKDDDGKTALQWAAKGKHRDIVALLLAKAKEIKNANK
jgi:serine/threonine-protein phosphatase 6 regulatory ankyrin repeat subunit B